jgi:hypothetical protein
MLYHMNGWETAEPPQPPPGFPNKMWAYNWYAKTFQWDPEKVDNLSLDLIEWFPLVAEAAAEADEVFQKQMEAQSTAVNRSRRWANG